MATNNTNTDTIHTVTFNKAVETDDGMSIAVLLDGEEVGRVAGEYDGLHRRYAVRMDDHDCADASFDPSAFESGVRGALAAARRHAKEQALALAERRDAEPEVVEEPADEPVTVVEGDNMPEPGHAIPEPPAEGTPAPRAGTTAALMLEALEEQVELCTTEIAEATGKSRVTVNRYAIKLVAQGVLTERREGTRAYYSLAAAA